LDINVALINHRGQLPPIVQRNRFKLPDLLLIAVAVVALVSYFWLVPTVHPDRYVNRRIVEVRAAQIASDYIGRSGYSTEGLIPLVEIKREPDVVNDLQDVYGRDAFANRELSDKYKALKPYYYRVSWVMPASDEAVGFEDGSINLSLSGSTAMAEGSNRVKFDVAMTIDGSILSLKVNDLVPIPVKPALRYLRSDGLTPGWTHQIPAGVPDSMLVRNMGFNIATFRNVDPSDAVVPNTAGPEWTVAQGLNYDLNRAEVLRLADYHLRRSVWHERSLRVDTVTSVTNSLAKVRYAVQDTLHHWSIKVDVTVHPYGALQDLTVSMQHTESEADLANNDIVDLISVVSFAILFLSLLIVMIRRLDARLIDLKFALTDAILAGLFADAMVLLRFIYSSQFIAGGFSANLLSIIPTLIAVGAGAALLTFVISGSGESIARTSGFDPLKTLDLLKRGFFFNRAVGMALIRGVAAGVIMAGFAVLPMVVFPDLHLHFSTSDSVFNVHAATWPALEIIAKSGFFSLIYSYLLLLGLGGFAWLVKPKWPLVYAVVALGGVLLGIIPMDVDPMWGTVLMALATMVILLTLYKLYGFATVLIGLFVYYLMWDGMSGWMLYNSPDLGMSMILGAVVLSLFAFGVTAVAAGQDLDEIPEYIPSYVAELSTRERMERELEIARNVQLNFLPTSTPEILHYDIAAHCRPAFDTGGDFYDFIPLEDGKMAVIVGDVSGKGIQAAFYMTLIKGFVQSLSERIEDPASILCEINRLFVRNAEKGIFVTMLYGIIDPSTGEFTFARAGHNPLIFKPAKDANPRHIPSPGLAIGLIGDDRFHAHIRTTKIIIPEDGFICLYTDGITEAMNLKRELYGDHRLLGQLREVQAESSASIVSIIDDDVAKFVGRAPQHDDMTLVVIRHAGIFPITYIG
jgi:phosphoserine phosphatase RsbU/P